MKIRQAVPGAIKARRGSTSLAGNAGFTLFETLLVLLIFSISVTVVSATIARPKAATRTKTAARTIASAMNYARERAVRERGTWYVESLEGGLLIASEAGGARKEIRLDDRVRVKALGGTTVFFYPSTGSSGGAFEVMDADYSVYYLVKVEASTGGVQVKAH